MMREFNAKALYDSKSMWEKVIRKTVKDTDILPITFHRSHKMAWLYMK